MPITDKGRWTSAILDERGRIVKGNTTEYGGIVFGTPNIPPQTPTAPPVPTVVSVSRGKISDETGVNNAIIRFKFDTNVTQWSVNVMGVSSTTGTIADSGGAVTAGTEITASIEWNELYQEGQNKVNIYGLNDIGWTPYEEDPNAVKKYYLKMDGVDDVVNVPSLTANEVIIDMVLDTNSKDQGVITLSNGYLIAKQDGSILGNNFTPIYIDGVLYSATTNPVPFNKRFTLRAMYGSGVTATGFLFRATSGGTQAKGRLYSAKYYNNGVLVAHYDFSNGTVSDISGNGKHATLTGNPTWVSY